MKRIKHTLTERWYAWENARAVAQNDPEVHLSARFEHMGLRKPRRKTRVDRNGASDAMQNDAAHVDFTIGSISTGNQSDAESPPRI